MKGGNGCRSWAGVLAVALLVLAACDDTPNPSFAQDMREQQALKGGDPYSLLNSLPSQKEYLSANNAPASRITRGQQLLLRVQENYSSMLTKLDTETKSGTSDEPFASCRATFAAAKAFATGDSAKPEAIGAAGKALFDQLNTCRDNAASAEKERAELLRRFASTGMVLVGLATIANGEETVGLDLWGQGALLAQKDKPGFAIKPQMFAH